jgi:hypothetical protein
MGFCGFSEHLSTPGWLAHDAELWAAVDLSDKVRVTALIDAVIKALQGVNGFSGQCQDEDELEARLVAAGYVHDPDRPTGGVGEARRFRSFGSARGTPRDEDDEGFSLVGAL